MNKDKLLHDMKEKHITELYHANTVLTSLSFLTVGGIMSRGAVEEMHLPQMLQTSDTLDKQYGIWCDVFFDSDDYHQRIHRLNFYGPVTFVYDSSVLTWSDLPEIKITSINPANWDDLNPENRYLGSCLEYTKGNIGQHLTLTNSHVPIPFIPYLKRVILDNPKLEDNHLFDAAKLQLSARLEAMKLYDKLEIRNCPDNCACKEKYHAYKPQVIWYKFRTE